MTTKRFLITKAIDTHYVRFHSQNARGIARMLNEWPTVPWTLKDRDVLAQHPDGRFVKLNINPSSQAAYFSLAQVLDIPAMDETDAVGMTLNSIASGAIIPTEGWPSPYLRAFDEPPTPQNYRLPHDPSTLKGIRVSHKARLKLQQDAYAGGYMRDPDIWRRRDMGRYIEALAKCAFADKRPAHVKAADEVMLRTGRKPIWSEDIERYQVVVEMTDDTMNGLIELAELFQVPVPARRTAISFSSVVLEAIGIGWLVPFAQPAKSRTA